MYTIYRELTFSIYSCWVAGNKIPGHSDADPLASMNTGIDVNQAFARCRTLLDALLTVNSLGIRSGLISITSANLHGWVAFESKHIVRALVVETGQIGRQALHVLSAVNGATYAYEAPEADSAEGSIDAGKARTIDSSAQHVHDDTTMMFGGDIVMFHNPQSDTKSGEIGMQFQRPLTDAEFRKGVFGEDADPHEEFMKKNTWLAQPEPPLQDFVQHRPDEFEDSGAISGGFASLSRAGFAIDFRDPAADINRRRATRDSMEMSALSAQEQKARRMPRFRYIAPLALAFGALLGYADSLYQQSHHPKDSTPLAIQMPDNGQAPFILPDATNSPPPPPSTPAPTQPSSSMPAKSAGSALAATKPPRVPEPADAKEFALAGSRTTLAQLEQLIRDYMAQKKFKHARDLAGAGFRSPVATPEEKRMFWSFFLECNHK